MYCLLQPIEDRKLNWRKEPRINQQNDDYIERMRQKRSMPLVCCKELLETRLKTSLFVVDFSRET